jgi:hypothetical protein
MLDAWQSHDLADLARLQQAEAQERCHAALAADALRELSGGRGSLRRLAGAWRAWIAGLLRPAPRRHRATPPATAPKVRRPDRRISSGRLAAVRG